MKLENALLLVEEAVRRHLQNAPSMILAIDGRCASGKTTFAKALASRLACPVIPCDSFFLPPEKRTAERLLEIGGNMDRERLRDEVLVPLKKGKPFSYRPFDCSTLALGEPIAVSPSPVTVVEGSYACHKELVPFYDGIVFLDVTAEKQKERLLLREGERAKTFFEKWIPLEERYFEDGRVKLLSDFAFFLE